MTEPPRRIGRPLDPESAAARTAQITVLTDPLHLQVLSAIACATSEQSVADAARLIGVPDADAASAITALEHAGLLTRSDPEHVQLTAEAWIRFGRLIAPSPASAVAQPPARAADLPPVAARIAATLSYRFSSHFSPETVARYVAESYTLLSERSQITTYLPSLTTRFAVDRLTALATAQGLILRGTPEVLFVCVQNAGRSQLAAAILRYLAGPRVHVRTAGSAPAAAIHQSIVDALDEIGIPLASEFPKPLTDEVVQAADYVITMGCGDACPVYPGRRYMDWAIADPIGLPMEGVRRVRDDVYDRVASLLEGMGLDARPR